MTIISFHRGHENGIYILMSKFVRELCYYLVETISIKARLVSSYGFLNLGHNTIFQVFLQSNIRQHFVVVKRECTKDFYKRGAILCVVI